ncbi:hypothetical protein JSE7799_00747 [Jannaschia seosinensis]|uniref:Phosphoadenosine phosphosulfate reductase n=1 Tax=Jannaschia seosinensis TaxID=313367 RepID=A0A0M7B8A9_9RHOB|nr:phosphoadenosine phosphosulfate reductase [Jannaschia seosinensis]CUH26727.1 hypothetical protein JSE7799_00747 [Jannaschia seosinensis]
MSDAPSPPMSREAHRHVLMAAAGRGGELCSRGDSHIILCRPGARETGGTLIVTFDTLDAVRARPGGLPLSTGLAQREGWATIDVMADGRTWFRDDYVHDFFDGLTDEGVFDDYDQVVFAGGGMGAYGAAAHSVAAPGATLFLVQPYATLDRDLTSWERRFRSSWSLPFGPRYGNAARMADAARRVFVVTDPTQSADAMHAALFSGAHVTHLRAHHAGHDIQGRLEAIDILDTLLAAAGRGDLTPARFAALWRARRDDPEWLAGLLRHVEKLDRPWLQAIAAGYITDRTGSAVARRRLNAALARLDEEDRDAPAGLEPQPVSARLAGA